MPQLKRCVQTERRWKRWIDSRGSPVASIKRERKRL